MRPDPEHQIDPNAVPAWRLRDGLSSLTWFAVPAVTGLAWYNDAPPVMACAANHSAVPDQHHRNDCDRTGSAMEAVALRNQ